MGDSVITIIKYILKSVNRIKSYSKKHLKKIK